MKRRFPVPLTFAYRCAIFSDIVIRSFRCGETERLARGHRVRRFVGFERVAQRKLAQLDAAATLDFLRAPPGNRLEALRGDRSGSYSIRINDRWRLCFRFADGNAYQPVAEVPAAFERRCIPPDCVVRRLRMPNMRPPHALSGGRLTALGATRGSTTGCYDAEIVDYH